MNTKLLMTTLLCIGLLFTACNDEDDKPAKPVVIITELGDGESHDNNHRAKIGESLHMDAEIVAEAKIDKIQIRIHPEGEHKSAGEHSEWELDTIFSGTGITGLKNLDFHKDFKIGSTVEPGDYHYDIMVIDMEGNTGSDEAELDLVK
ncbi:MAG: DUF4625 domain-containing protein [Bacteroidales bacterium]|nr:DUF4625 domain-containing protein [Bacteroidales bacterium]